MSQPAERVSSLSPRCRRGQILRRLTAGLALSAAAVTAGLAGVPATSAANVANTTDENQATTHLGQLAAGDWGVATAPEHFRGTTAHTVSVGS